MKTLSFVYLVTTKQCYFKIKKKLVRIKQVICLNYKTNINKKNSFVFYNDMYLYVRPVLKSG